MLEFLSIIYAPRCSLRMNRNSLIGSIPLQPSPSDVQGQVTPERHPVDPTSDPHPGDMGFATPHAPPASPPRPLAFSHHQLPFPFLVPLRQPFLRVEQDRLGHVAAPSAPIDASWCPTAFACGHDARRLGSPNPTRRDGSGVQRRRPLVSPQAGLPEGRGGSSAGY